MMIKEWLDQIWQNTINHKWSKDIFRANLLYILIILIYDCFHLIYHHLRIVPAGIFFRLFIVLNVCLFFKALLDYLSPDD